MSNDRQNVTEKIFKQVQKVIQHFCKKVGGEWHYLNTELPYIPMFENIVLITMAQVIRKEKVNFDDWDKKEIGKEVYQMIHEFLHNGDHATDWSENDKCFIKLNNLIKAKEMPTFVLPDAPAINRAIKKYRGDVESFVTADIERNSSLNTGRVDENLEGNVPA